MSIFFQGFLTGLAYVMPIGAQNVFLIHSSLRVKAPKNFLIAFYVLLADVSLAMICYFGLGKILTLNLFVRLVFSILGSLVLFKMGINLIISKESAVNSGLTLNSINYSHTEFLKKSFLVTFANPQAIIDGALIYGSLRASFSDSGVLMFFGGNLIASIVWFCGISGVIAFIKNTKLLKSVKYIEKICGCIMIIIGLKIIWTLFLEFYEVN